MFPSFALILSALLVSAPPALLPSLRSSDRPPNDQSAVVLTCMGATRPEIEAAVGHPLDSAAEQQGKFDSTCNYSSGEMAVTISIRYLTQPLDLPAETGHLTAAFPGSKLRAIKGMGDQAYALDILRAGAQLHVLPNQREYLLVSVLGMTNARESAAAALKIAHAVLRSVHTIRRWALYWPDHTHSHADSSDS